MLWVECKKILLIYLWVFGLDRYEEENENEVKDICIYFVEEIDDIVSVCGIFLFYFFKSKVYYFVLLICLDLCC